VTKIDALIMRLVDWVGNSLENVKKFPEEVQKDIGDELQE